MLQGFSLIPDLFIGSLLIVIEVVARIILTLIPEIVQLTRMLKLGISQPDLGQILLL